ncbi:unnamed protein product [Caenorhabditis sp. 36 PRJEB53466]|nr:unnamed protein product [Caenorhabditis sp. 36 PRJEB53466]
MGNHEFLVFGILLMLTCGTAAMYQFCIQCVSGRFMDRRWLFQDHFGGVEIQWRKNWSGTDCARGIANKAGCLYHSCVQIIVEKYYAGKLYYDGMLMDCSQNLIRYTVDLPYGTNWGNYFETGVFETDRRGFRITHNFTMDHPRIPNLAKAMVNYTQVINPFAKSEEFTTFSIVVYVTGVVLLTAMVIFVPTMLIWSCRQRNAELRRPNNLSRSGIPLHKLKRRNAGTASDSQRRAHSPAMSSTLDSPQEVGTPV